MCGIAGFVDSDRHAAGTTRVDTEFNLVHRMCEVIRHRGPDDEGIHVEPGVGLGMRRLSIIDLAGGRQPIHNEARTIWVVFNGEIYNYQQLRSELEGLGHQFYTSSDTETIVHAYEQ
jgi:asparagine synthase (glutamine-hydrolysing)